MKQHTCFLSSTWSVSPPFGTIPFIRHHFSLTPAASVPCTPFSPFRWWQVIRYLQARVSCKMEASPLGAIIDNRAKPPAGLPGFVLTRSRTRPSAANELSNFAGSTVSSFSRGWKVCKIILIDNCPLFLKSFWIVFGIFNLIHQEDEMFYFNIFKFLNSKIGNSAFDSLNYFFDCIAALWPAIARIS